MLSVKIYGAGSIGNHLAHACRTKGWNVLICDTDPLALQRTKKEIYPSRYGRWDAEIRLASPDQIGDEEFDLVIVGTPPDSHIPIALADLKKAPPRALLLEKPMCQPSLKGCQELQELAANTGTFVAVGYNHTLTKHTVRAAELIRSGFLGDTITISARFREFWGGIFGAHPWLSGPQDSYLGFWEKGGGASGEHSHAVNIWQHFAYLLGAGRVVEVSAVLDVVDDGAVKYDRVCQIHAISETGLVGTIVQDVITEPPLKSLRVQGSSGFLEWCVNWDKGNDSLRYWNGQGELRDELFAKTRPDDFKGEIDHIEAVLQGKAASSPISLERGMETMLVVAAAHKSHAAGRRVRINYGAGCSPQALELIQ